MASNFKSDQIELNSSQDDLPSEIAKWAFKELSFSIDGTLNLVHSVKPNQTENCFSELIKNSKSRLIWEYIIKNVKRQETDTPFETIDDSEKTVDPLDIEISKLEAEIAISEKEVIELEAKCEILSQTVSHSTRSSILLATKQSSIVDKSKYIRRMETELNKISESEKNETSDDELGLESNEILNSFKAKEIQSLIAKQSENNEEATKNEIIDATLSLLETSSPKAILKRLTEQTRNQNYSIRSLTKNLDVKNDLLQLGYNLDDKTGELSEISIHEAAHIHMETLFNKLRKMHIEKHVDFCSTRDEIETLKTKRNDLKSLLIAEFRGEENESLLIQLIETEMTKHYLIGQINYCRDYLKTNENAENLTEMIEMVIDFEEQVKEKHSKIMSTLATNTWLPIAITEENVNLKTALEINKFEENVSSSDDDEISAFSQLTIKQLMVKEYAHFKISSDCLAPFSDDLKSVLGIPAFNSRLEIISELLRIKTENERLNNRVIKINSVRNDSRELRTGLEERKEIFAVDLREAKRKLKKKAHVYLKNNVPAFKENAQISRNIEIGIKNMEEQPAFEVYEKISTS